MTISPPGDLLSSLLASSLPSTPPTTGRMPGFSAIVLGAGRGTRLEPVTTAVCKPLAPVLNIPLLYWTMAMLRRAGVGPIAINTHHRSDQLDVAAALLCRRDGLDVRTVREDRPSGPAGGVVRCREVLPSTECTAIASGDALADLDLTEMIRDHLTHGTDLTVLAQEVPDPWRFGVLELCGRDVVNLHEKPDGPAAGSIVNGGIYIMGRHALNELELPVGRSREYNFAQVIRTFIARGLTVRAYISETYWTDIGTPDSLIAANMRMLGSRTVSRIAVPDDSRPGLWQQEECRISDDVRLEGPTLVGSRAEVGPQVTLNRAVIGAGARIEGRAELTDVVVLPNQTVSAGRVLTNRLELEI